MTQLERLYDVLTKIGIEPAPEDIADFAWLATYIATPSPGGLKPGDGQDRRTGAADPLRTPKTTENFGEDSNRQVGAGLPKEREGDDSARRGLQGEQAAPPARPAGDLIPSAGKETSSEPGVGGVLPFRSPAAPGLPGTLGLERALRPLMRKDRSRAETILNEELTAELSAEEGFLMPVLEWASERWLEVAIVVEESRSMDVWRQTISELRRLLERHGAFRRVQTWGLAGTDNPGQDIALYFGSPLTAGSRRSASLRTRDPKELFEPTRRRLLLVVSDCVASAWRDGRIARLLDYWSTECPLALLQTLPRRMWGGTGLSQAQPVFIHAPRAGVPNRSLSAKNPYGDDEEREAKHVLVPVLTLEPESFASWVRMLVGTGDAWTAGIALGTMSKDEMTQAAEKARRKLSLPAPPPSPTELLRDFRSIASPMAQQLALHFAAVPLSLPIMRLVQKAVSPESRQVHLAEVLLCGILQRGPESDASDDPERVVYDFQPGLRDLLLDSLPTPNSFRVLQDVSDYVESELGQTSEFSALLADPTSSLENLSRRHAPFARITAKTLLRLGGQYAEAARRILGALNLGGQGLTELPISIRDQAVDVRVLDLSNNKLGVLPDWLSDFAALEEINLQHNRLTEFPSVLLRLTNLKVLNLSGYLSDSDGSEEPQTNQLRAIPAGIERLVNLRELHLGSNALADLPASVARLSKLETLYLDRNRFARIPDAIYDLTGLCELTIGGSDFSEILPDFAKLENLGFFDVAPENIVDPEIARLAIQGPQSERPAALREYFQKQSSQSPVNRVDPGASGIFKFGTSIVQVIAGDIVGSNAQVLVSSDDANITMGGGVSRSILNAGGESIIREAATKVPAELGDVVVTAAGTLNASYIFHVITIAVGMRSSVRAVTNATSRCLDLLDSHSLSTIAFPIIGTGAAGVQFEDAANAMAKSIADHLEWHSESLVVSIYLHDRFGRMQESDFAPIFSAFEHQRTVLDRMSRSLSNGGMERERFFSPGQIKSAISRLGLIGTNEKPLGLLRVYRSAKQQSWLMATNRRIVLAVDDKTPRNKRPFIRWSTALDMARVSIVNEQYGARTGLASLFEGHSFLYSRQYFDGTGELSKQVAALLKHAKSEEQAFDGPSPRLRQLEDADRESLQLSWRIWRDRRFDVQFGHECYRFNVSLEGSASVLDKVLYVQYLLPDAWPNTSTPARRVSRSDSFLLKELTWGDSVDVSVNVVFATGDPVLRLSCRVDKADAEASTVDHGYPTEQRPRTYNCCSVLNQGQVVETRGELEHDFGSPVPAIIDGLSKQVWSWSRSRTKPGGGGQHLIFGPYSTDLRTPGHYLIKYRLKATGIDPGGSEPTTPVLQLDVAVHPPTQILEPGRIIIASDLVGNDWKEFDLEVWSAGFEEAEFRVLVFDGASSTDKPDSIHSLEGDHPITILFDTISVERVPDALFCVADSAIDNDSALAFQLDDGRLFTSAYVADVALGKGDAKLTTNDFSAEIRLQNAFTQQEIYAKLVAPMPPHIPTPGWGISATTALKLDLATPKTIGRVFTGAEFEARPTSVIIFGYDASIRRFTPMPASAEWQDRPYGLVALQNTSREVMPRRGLSGSPVVDSSSGTVVGMVTVSRATGEYYMLPIADMGIRQENPDFQVGAVGVVAFLSGPTKAFGSERDLIYNELISRGCRVVRAEGRPNGERNIKVFRSRINECNLYIAVAPNSRETALSVGAGGTEEEYESARSAGIRRLVYLNLDSATERNVQGHFTPLCDLVSPATTNEVVRQYSTFDELGDLLQADMTQIVDGVWPPKRRFALSQIIGQWFGTWMRKGHQRRAVLSIRDDGSALFIVSFTKNGIPSIIEEELAVSANGTSFSLRGTTARFIEKGGAARWLLDEVSLEFDPEHKRLYGFIWDGKHEKINASFRMNRRNDSGRHPQADPTGIPSILVAGTGTHELNAAVLETSRSVGTELASAGFGLVTGGWPGVDYVVAESYYERWQRLQRIDPVDITRIVTADRRADFKEGLNMVVTTEEDTFTESVRYADAIVLIGGLGGTYGIYLEALNQGKPIFPLPTTGGDAEQAFADMLMDWRKRGIPGVVEARYVEALSRTNVTPLELSHSLIQLVESCLT